MPKIKFLSLAIIFSTTSVVAIANIVKPVQSQVPLELDRLEYFRGTWRCQQPAAPASPSGVFTWTVKRDLNDFWYLGNAEETQSPDDGKPINSREFLGYNIASKKLFRSVVVGNGNSFNMTASDWQDGKLIWSGTVVDRAKGKSLPLRQEIVRDSQDRFTATYFILDEESNWQPVVNETCDRLAA
ncbi:DUF1579 family protein [Pleurocapsa sp. PCC 7319]|uniref:DUF1579 family protein n=1 Tax=Pleurocapsa sp. PCC 7319 TaxID=118161 RepID=UPI00034AAECA|nr:DUF1579 family protein [Pleurocapsa sp. PCC 7319]